MAIHQQALNYGQRRLARRLGRSVPWLGIAVALIGVAAAIRRKGFVGGTLDCALNATPFVGAAKNLAEMARWRDFIRDRQRMPTHT
jgi:hypothetical protein